MFASIEDPIIDIRKALPLLVSLPVLIHGIVQIALAALIFLLEIISLGLSTYGATGAGIWCNLVFMTTEISTVLLGIFQ